MKLTALLLIISSFVVFGCSSPKPNNQTSTVEDESIDPEIIAHFEKVKRAQENGTLHEMLAESNSTTNTVIRDGKPFIVITSGAYNSSDNTTLIDDRWRN